ncbi:hypothetical protein NE865_09532 [Phthorimaea operculella]|nr:hypothetical protein NE865_09532 [Phthorimaea operculella]
MYKCLTLYLASQDKVWFEIILRTLYAELVAVEGKEIETHYVLARERIRRWNSTSKCYLLVENLPTPLQAGGIASASVWSSCGCRQRLLAAVTSGGRAVHWAAVPAPNPANNSDLCRFNYTFPVTADMAPVSSLLVYYVTEMGEPVSDVASFHVKLLHKEVAVAVEERRWWYPRAALQLRVLAPPDSTMCLIGARAPPDAKFDPHQTSADHDEQPGPEFVSAGVSLFVGGGACGGGVLYRQRTAPVPRPTSHLVPPASHDRLWMWKCFNYTGVLYRKQTAPVPRPTSHLVPPASHDRLWMWKCFNYTYVKNSFSCGGGVLYLQRTAPVPRPTSHLVPPASHDRLWMWKCFNYTHVQVARWNLTPRPCHARRMIIHKEKPEEYPSASSSTLLTASASSPD